MKRFIITSATLLLAISTAGCDEPVEDGMELRAAEVDVESGEGMDEFDTLDGDGESIAVSCPPDGAYTTTSNPGFTEGWVEYWSIVVGECNGRSAIRGYCPSSMGGTTFNNQCGRGCVWSDDGGMQ